MGLSRLHRTQRGNPQVQLHRNAKLVPAQRKLLVERVTSGWPVTEAAEAAGVSRQTVYKWLRRFREGGEPALEDRSSRPHRIPVRTPQRSIRRFEQLRRRRHMVDERQQVLRIGAQQK